MYAFCKQIENDVPDLIANHRKFKISSSGTLMDDFGCHFGVLQKWSFCFFSVFEVGGAPGSSRESLFQASGSNFGKKMYKKWYLKINYVRFYTNIGSQISRGLRGENQVDASWVPLGCLLGPNLCLKKCLGSQAGVIQLWFSLCFGRAS